MSAQRRIVCAAIRAADGDVLIGIRHYSRDMHAQMEARTDGAKFRNRIGDDQGFVDQWGDYLTRRDAYDVANDARQITNYPACIRGVNIDGEIMKLTSEGLY